MIPNELAQAVQAAAPVVVVIALIGLATLVPSTVALDQSLSHELPYVEDTQAQDTFIETHMHQERQAVAHVLLAIGAAAIGVVAFQMWIGR